MNMISLVRATEQERAHFVNRKLCFRIVVWRVITIVISRVSLFERRRQRG